MLAGQGRLDVAVLTQKSEINSRPVHAPSDRGVADLTRDLPVRDTQLEACGEDALPLLFDLDDSVTRYVGGGLRGADRTREEHGR